MIGFFAMELMPLLFGVAYELHSLRRRRYPQVAAVGVLLLLLSAALSVLLWEFLAVP